MSGRFVLKGDLIVLDRETGLAWQRGASPDKYEWHDGFEYIDRINAEKFGGYDDWRYPTDKELETLILPEETMETRLYLDPVFEPTDGCWSCIEDDHHRSIYADFYYGDLYWFEQKYVRYFIRGVRNYEWEIRREE